MIKRLLRRLLPASMYSLGKSGLRAYRNRQRAGRLVLSEAAFCRILTVELGLGCGDIVFVHSSIDRLNLAFPFFKVLGLLRQIVGEQGTLLFPASQLTERPETWLAKGEVFDLRRSTTPMGIVPELARRQRGALRSLHPTHSVVALGPLAAELIADHHCDPAPFGPLSPYYKVVQRGGVVVGLGVDVDVLTMVHCVEDLLGEHFPVETRHLGLGQARVRDLEGAEHEIETEIGHPRMRFRRMLHYFDRHIGTSAWRRLLVEGVPFYRVDAAQLYERMRELAERGVTIYWRGIHRDSFWERTLSRVAEKLEER